MSIEKLQEHGTPRLVIIRGLPGSGKSTLARTFEDFAHFEADMFFENQDGVYNFDPSRIKDAHQWCRSQVKNHLERGHNVVVSNTFTTRWEMDYYLELAEEIGTKPEIIRCKGEFSSLHGVPDHAIQRMTERWENIEGEKIHDPMSKEEQMYPDVIMQAVRQNLDLGENDSSMDDTIMKMSKNEVLDRVSTWNNLIGFGPSIRSWVEGIWRVDLDIASDTQKFVNEAQNVAEYVAATVGMGADPSGPEWQKVHRGRAMSSVAQLNGLKRKARNLLEKMHEKKEENS